MDASLREKARRIMRGGYDLHVHAAPSHRERALDDFELARSLDVYGMAGAITKSHHEITAGRAAIANRHSGAQGRLYGAVTLNRSVGGLNPNAVESALSMGARMVWLPTVDVKTGLSVTATDGSLREELYRVIEIVKKFDVYLATGHLRPNESAAVCAECIRLGTKVILTHPDSKNMATPVADQAALARKGVLIEKAWGNVFAGFISATDMAASIASIGAENVFLVTDLGQKGRPMPMEGMCDFVVSLLENGISDTDIITMLRINPARIVGAAAQTVESCSKESR